MAIGIWGKPAQLDIQPYDREFMLRAADAVQKRADTAESNYDALLGEFNKLPALPQDLEKRNSIIKSYKQQLSSAYDSAKGDVTKLIPVIKNLGRDFRENLSYGPLGAITGNYSARKEHEKQIQDAYEKGFINQQRRDALLAVDLNDYQGIGEGENYGKFNSYKGSTPAKEVDLSEKARKLADDWKADKITRGGYKQDKSGLYFINTKGVKEYVDPNEVYTYVKSVLDQDPEVRSFVDQETRLGTYGIKPDSELISRDANGYPVQINPEAYINNYRSQFTDKAARYAAAKEGFLQTEVTQSDLSWVPEDIRKDGEPIDVSTLSSPLRKHKVTANMSLEDMDSVEFDESGNVKPAKIQKIVGTPGTSRSPSGIDRVDVDIPREEVNTYIKTLQDKYPVLKNRTPKEAFEIIKDATKSLESSNAAILKPGKAALQSAQDEIFGKNGYGDLHERTFYAINSKGEKSELNYKSVAKMLGYGDAIPDKALKVAAVTGVDVSGEDAGDYTVTIPASDGTATTLMVSSNDQIKRVAQLSGIVNNLVYMGGGTSVMKDNKGNITYKITVTNNLDPDSRTFDPKVTIEDANGNKDADLSLQDIHLMTATQVANKITPKKHK